MTLNENIKRLANGTPAVVIAGEMTKSGFPITESSVIRWLDGATPNGDAIPYLALVLGTDPNGLYEGVLPVKSAA